MDNYSLELNIRPRPEQASKAKKLELNIRPRPEQASKAKKNEQQKVNIDRVPYFYKYLKACFSYLHANIATFLPPLKSP